MNELRETYKDIADTYGTGMAIASMTFAVVAVVGILLGASAVLYLYLNLVGVTVTYWQANGAFVGSALLVAGIQNLAHYMHERFNK